jgi:hypothetical protein
MGILSQSVFCFKYGDNDGAPPVGQLASAPGDDDLPELGVEILDPEEGFAPAGAKERHEDLECMADVLFAAVGLKKLVRPKSRKVLCK